VWHCQGDSDDVCAEHDFLAHFSGLHKVTPVRTWPAVSRTMSEDESDVGIFFSDVSSDSSDTPELTDDHLSQSRGK
jgi:hypothetical protein